MSERRRRLLMTAAITAVLVGVCFLPRWLSQLIWPPLWSWYLSRVSPRASFRLTLGLMGAIGVVLDVIPPWADYKTVAIDAGWLIVAIIWWLWDRRKKIRKALAGIGAKARARIEKMKRNMPRPRVLRPV